jgi:signal transduction histidine kinase
MFLLSFGIITLIILFQVVLIKPYYRNSKIQTINSYVNDLEYNIIDNENINEKNIDKVTYSTLNNNFCVLVFNKSGNVIYNSDSLGEGCLLTQNIDINNEVINPTINGVFMIDLFNGGEDYQLSLTNEKSNQEMILYGEVVKNKLANYYVFVNSPIEPFESVTNFIASQYLLLIFLVGIISFSLALFLSNRLASPIIKMNHSANKLASGNYNTHFDNDSYSEINELADTLNDATYKLSKVDELRKDLIANVSHDIKTPLTMIKAYAEMIIDISGDVKEKREEHLTVIIKEVDYLDVLIKDMQELSKMQAGFIVLNRTNVDLVSIVKNTITLFDALLESRKINVTLNAEDSCIIYVDGIKMQQVIYNFLSNAINHSDDNSNIKIKIIQNEDLTRLEVKDYGSGISEKDLPYVWDRYYKIDKKFKRNIDKSTGLGLAIVKAILEAHHTKYGVKSKLNHGSTFYFELNREIIDEEAVANEK